MEMLSNQVSISLPMHTVFFAFLQQAIVKEPEERENKEEAAEEEKEKERLKEQEDVGKEQGEADEGKKKRKEEKDTEEREEREVGEGKLALTDKARSDWQKIAKFGQLVRAQERLRRPMASDCDVTLHICT